MSWNVCSACSRKRTEVLPALAMIVERTGCVKLEGGRLEVALKRFRNGEIDYAARHLCEDLNHLMPVTPDKLVIGICFFDVAEVWLASRRQAGRNGAELASGGVLTRPRGSPEAGPNLQQGRSEAHRGWKRRLRRAGRGAARRRADARPHARPHRSSVPPGLQPQSATATSHRGGARAVASSHSPPCRRIFSMTSV
jgi:hypothetical protein